MDEHELDSLLGRARSFGIKDAIDAETRSRRLTALGVALWGRTGADLQRQLTARHPQIPAGFTLDEFRALQRMAEAISARLKDARGGWLWSSLTAKDQVSSAISAGTRTFPAWEARCEILRRAIEYLESR
ncbi:MAG TPA: hypothetical protein VKX45_24965 [Bryobacteraceae bacterium]|jgi:hypothetical protein|nr:hypothetical protein [Bryobacteraceae bacterium]